MYMQFGMKVSMSISGVEKHKTVKICDLVASSYLKQSLWISLQRNQLMIKCIGMLLVLRFQKIASALNY